MAQHVWETTGGCEAASCADVIYDWLEGEDEAVWLLAAGLLGEGGPAGTCRVHHAASLQGRPLSDYAAIVHEVFTRSSGVEVSGAPRAVARDGGDAYGFDFAAPGGEAEGTVLLVGGADRFTWMRCEGPEPPTDRWRSITETLGLIDGAPEPATVNDGSQALQEMLPVWVAGRPLLSYSHSGLDYLRRWGRATEEQLQALEADPHALEGFMPAGTTIDDIEFANAGRAATDDPPYFVSALRIRDVPAWTMPRSMVVDHDSDDWREVRFGDRLVHVGTEEMLDQGGRPGRPYVYDVDDVRFVVTTDDEAWAREAIARLRPEAAIENAGLFVSLPEGWRPGVSPVLGEEGAAEAYDSGLLAAAYDDADASDWFVPTLEVFYTGTRLETDPAWTLDGWAELHRAEPWPDRTTRSIERVRLESGEAVRFEMTTETDQPGATIAEVLYRIAAPAGVFELVFSVAAEDLPEHEATFEELAHGFMARDPDPDGRMAQLARGELTRTEYEMLAGGHTVVPE